MRMSPVFAVILSLILPLPALAEAPVPTLTVTGQGRVATAPDMATISLGVTAQAKAAADAMAQVSSGTADMIAALKGAGIASADLQTSGLNLNPLWKNRSYNSGETPQIDGFVASNTVTVRVRDLAALGGILDRVVGLGANTFSGLRFGLQQPEPAEDDARRAAVADAMRKARLYAEAAGIELGHVLSISESGGYAPQPLMLEAAAMRSMGDVPVEAGEVSVNASVTMVFLLDD